MFLVRVGGSELVVNAAEVAEGGGGCIDAALDARALPDPVAPLLAWPDPPPS